MLIYPLIGDLFSVDIAKEQASNPLTAADHVNVVMGEESKLAFSPVWNVENATDLELSLLTVTEFVQLKDVVVEVQFTLIF